MADNGGSGRFTTLHELCERCQQLGQIIWEGLGSYDLGYVEKLAPEGCHSCAIIYAITRSMIRETDGAKPSPQTRIFLQCVVTVSYLYRPKTKRAIQWEKIWIKS